MARVLNILSFVRLERRENIWPFDSAWMVTSFGALENVPFENKTSTSPNICPIENIRIYRQSISRRKGPPLEQERKERKEMFYLTTYSTHFIYGYIASDIW